jgi:hypothetical protein
VAIILAGQRHAFGWDAQIHRLIARLAISALPDSPLKRYFGVEERQLEEFAVAPDEVLRPMYGEAEGRRHYIDLENFGAEPFARLSPDFATMERTYGPRVLDKSGTLPWAIEDEAQKMRDAWQSGDCGEMLRHAGYLAHYVGDASQPLHTTRYFDGYTRSDRGEHRRLESSADYHVREIAEAVRGEARARPIESVWDATIAELKRSNALVRAVAENDRAARDVADGDRAAYETALMRSEESMIVNRVVDAATTLSAIWLYEWQQTGMTSACLGKGNAP